MALGMDSEETERCGKDNFFEGIGLEQMPNALEKMLNVSEGVAKCW
jgi:hypothetical protein